MRRAVDVISDMVCHPAMSSEAIELEKQVIIEEIRNFEDTPEEIVHELLGKSVWKQGTMGNSILGSKESVSRLNRKRVLPFFRGFYVSPNTIVAASGKVNHRELVESVDGMVNLPEEIDSGTVRAQDQTLPRIYHEERDVSQCYICMGIEAPSYADGRRYASILLSLIVGGGMTSRLFQEVRDRQGLAYSVYCSCEFYRDTGIFVIFLAVDPAKARKAVRSVSREIKRLKHDGLRRGELASAKQQLKGNLILGLESTSARMSRLARQEFYLNDYFPMETTLASVMAVRSDKVMAETERLFDSSRFSLVVVGPHSTSFPTARDLTF
jgi:predicted Zn-dependent peptidase